MARRTRTSTEAEIQEVNPYLPDDDCLAAIRKALGDNSYVAFLRGRLLELNWSLGSVNHAATEAEVAQHYQNKLVEVLKTSDPLEE